MYLVELGIMSSIIPRDYFDVVFTKNEFLKGDDNAKKSAGESPAR